jgi:hypothetical protein
LMYFMSSPTNLIFDIIIDVFRVEVNYTKILIDRKK